MRAWEPESAWDIAAGVAAGLLLLNFIVETVLFFAMTGVIFLNPGPAYATAGLLLAGMLGYLAFGKKFSKLWRRLLLAGVLCNLALVAFFLLGIVAMTVAWL